MAIIFKDYVGGTLNQVLQRVNVISVANYRWKKYQYGDAGLMSTPQGRTYKDIISEEGENNVIKIPKLHEGGSWTFDVEIFKEKHSFRFELPAYEGEPDTLYLFIHYDTPTVKGSQQLTPINIKSDEYFYFILGDAVNNLTSDLPDIYKQYFTGYLLWLMPQQTFSVWGDNNYYFTDIGYYSDYGKISQKLELKGKIPIKDNTEQPSGGQGGGEIPNEPIEDETLPDSLIIDSNLLTIYNPGKLTVQAISDFLNSGSFLDLWKHKSEAIQSVISFHSIPIKDTELSTQTTTFKLGGVAPEQILDGTPITIRKATKQYYDVDLGEIVLEEIVGGFMDYSPYVKMMVYLPFIGVVNVNINDFMGDIIKLKYSIDILTGDAVAKVSNSKTLVCTFSGNVAVKYPLVATDYSNIYSQALRVGETSLSSFMNGGYGTNALPNLLSLTTSKPQYKYSGSIGGSLGVLGNMTPYIIFHRPILSYPKDYEKYCGYMSNITSKLSKLKGYTKVKEIHLDGIECLDIERNEIEELLKSGVIL